MGRVGLGSRSVSRVHGILLWRGGRENGVFGDDRLGVISG